MQKAKIISGATEMELEQNLNKFMVMNISPNDKFPKFYSFFPMGGMRVLIIWMEEIAK